MKKPFFRIFLISLAAILCVSAFSLGAWATVKELSPSAKYAEHEGILLWGNTTPPYNNMGENTDEIPMIYPYIAENNPTGICAVIYPGGGYSHLSKENEGSKIAQFLNENGITAFVVHYRTTDYGKQDYDYRAILSDGLRAVKHVRYNAEEYGIDPDKIFTIGFSAGGHLTYMSGTHYDFAVEDPAYAPDEIDEVSARPNAIAPCYAVCTIEKSYSNSGTRTVFAQGDAELEHFFSAENSVTEDTPPTFLWHTWDDGTVPVKNSLDFAKELAKYGIPCEMHLYAQGSHGIALAKDNPTAYTWSSYLVKWAFRILSE